MKVLTAVCLVAVIAVVAGRWHPRSPWSKHAGQHQVRPRPSGRPMMGGRPTGRPFRFPTFWERHRARIQAWKKAQMAKDDQDETAVIGGSMMSHVKSLRNHFKDVLANRPTGRPQPGLLKSIIKKYKEALKQLQGMRPTGRPTKADKKHYKMAYEKLKKHYMNAKKEAKKPVVADEDETAIVGYSKYFKSMRDRYRKFMSSRPTGRPGGLNQWHMKFVENMKKKFAMRPTGRPAPSQKRLSDFLSKMKARYQKMRDHKMKKADDDEDETAILGRWGKHFQGRKDRFNKYMSSRPTGRPSFLKQWHMKYVENMKKKLAMRPTGRPSPSQSRLSAFLSKLKARWQKMRDQKMKKADDDEDETAILGRWSKYFQSLKERYNKYKESMKQKMAMRPTGRPTQMDGKSKFASYLSKLRAYWQKIKEQRMKN